MNRNRRKGKKQKNKNTPWSKFKRYESTPTRKLISAYGGVGSILETLKGAITVKPFDEWSFYKNQKHLDPENHIKDERLLSRLKQYFTDIESIFRLPETELNYIYPKDKKATVSGAYFPKWMFCPKCKRFDKLENWLRHWKNNARDEDYNPPRCFSCYNKAKKEKKGWAFIELEQVRFILTSPSGNITDVPWDKWVFCKNYTKSNNKEIEDKKDNFTRLNMNIVPREDIYYRYVHSDKFNNMTGISIIAYEKGTNNYVERQTLKGIFSLRVSEQDLPELSQPNSSVEMKVAIRSSNSVYYPNIIQSLQLPLEKSDAITEIEYREEEYNFITSKNEFESEQKNGLYFEKLSYELINKKGIKSVYRLDTIKMTNIQVSYTRQEPIDSNYYLSDKESVSTQDIKKKFTSNFGKSAKYLPAIENLGEGIFFEFDDEKISEWINANGVELQHRAESIQKNYDSTKLSHYEEKDITLTYLLVHTFSHLIIKELEFLCGYPATSIRERLYISPNMQGVLIYTVAGAEGSYGGLVSQCDTNRIEQIIESALERSLDCSADPICESTDIQGQGVGGTNLAACFSCTLLPETSCEEFNRFLDRKTVHSFFNMNEF